MIKKFGSYLKKEYPTFTSFCNRFLFFVFLTCNGEGKLLLPESGHPVHRSVVELILS